MSEDPAVYTVSTNQKQPMMTRTSIENPFDSEWLAEALKTLVKRDPQRVLRDIAYLHQWATERCLNIKT